MPRSRLGGGSSRNRQGGELSTDATRFGIDTDVFKLLSNDRSHEMARPEPRIERWLNCWRNP